MSRSRSNRRRLRTAIALSIAAIALAAVPIAMGQILSADHAVIYGAQFTTWDTDNDNTNCAAPTNAFSPIDDGAWGTGADTADDAFDAGLMLIVGTTSFNDSDGKVNRTSLRSLKAAGNADGLHVTEQARALTTSPTLRVLIELRNNGAAKTRELLLSSDVGSDGDTGLRATSNGDLAFTTADRWVVSSDDPTDPGDPPVTQVLYGKGAPRQVVGFVPDDNDCLTVIFDVTIPAHSTRNLLFFAEINNPASNTPAINGAAKFNAKHLNRKLLTGLSRKTKNRIVNWDL